MKKSVIHRGGTEFGHSRMLLTGIQARPQLDPRLRHSGVTPLGSQPHVPDTRPSCWGQPILPLSVLRGHEKKSKHHQNCNFGPNYNQILATADFREKGFFLTTRASAVSIVHFIDWTNSGCYVPHHDCWSKVFAFVFVSILGECLTQRG